MSDIKKQQKERDYGDSIPEEDAQSADGDVAYRDGSAVNECWAHEKDHV